MMETDLSGVSPDSGTVDAGECIKLPELGEVFCDWLSVTFHPTESLTWLEPFLSSIGFCSTDTGDYTSPHGGFIRHKTAKRWQALSFSGGALAVVRSHGLLNELLRLISGHPHKVTRLDAAYDLAVDAAPIVNKLWAFYQSGTLKLNVWNELQSQAYLRSRFDGALSGTFYAGNRRTNKITARVYDKRSEYYDRHRVDIGNRIRYELTVRTDQVTLRDVALPSAVFWHYMSPSLLKAPPVVDSWVGGNPFVWAGTDSTAVLSVEDRLARVVHGSSDLNSAMAMCGDSLPMFDLLLKLLRLRVLGRASKLPDWSPSYE